MRPVCEICGKPRTDAFYNKHTGVTSCRYCERYLDAARIRCGIPILTDADRLRVEIAKRDGEEAA